MRVTRWIAVACVAIGATAPASFASTTTHVAGNAASAPASAGKLTQGPIEYFWPRGHVEAGDRDGGARTATAAASPGNNLVYGGGGSVGTVSKTPAVYIVFWGSQWSQTDPYAT